MFYFYILVSEKTGKYYYGSTENFELRMALHNSGKVRSTKNDFPWKKLFVQNFPTLIEARQRELQVKKWKNRTAVEKMIKHHIFR